MGYACPVCEDPQADAGHLANHLALTAILGDDAHGAWLDDHVPGWGEMDETALAEALRDDVDETEFPQVFEDTVGGLSESAESPAERSGALFEDGSSGSEADRGHEHGPGHHDGPPPGGGDDGLPDVAPVEPADPADEETAAILEEAREMTRAMMGADAETAGEERAAGEGADDGDDDGATDDAGPGDETATDHDGADRDGEADHDEVQDRADAADVSDGNENE